MALLQYDFMQHALAAGVLAGIACGVVGTYVVVRRMVFISGGLAHTTFGGIGLAYYLGFNPLLGALVFALVGAVGIGAAAQRTRLSEDTAIGVLWAAGMALGVVFIGLAEGYAPDLFSYLFGNILTVRQSELFTMLVLDAVVLATVFILYKEFLAISFDEEFSRVGGIPSRALDLLLLALVALTIVTVIRVVGIVLVIALLTIPPAIARYYTTSLSRMMLLSSLIGVSLAIAGLLLSYILDIASGATIILLGSAALLIVLVAQRVARRSTASRTTQ